MKTFLAAALLGLIWDTDAQAAADLGGPGKPFSKPPPPPPPSCNHNNCPGGDIPWANPLPSWKGSVTDCAVKCNATTGCVGWVYQGPDGGGGCGASTADSKCYLKASYKACSPLKCTCSGANGKAPVPVPPPPPPPPPPPCPECVQTAGWVGGEWHPANASNSLWMAPAFFDGYINGEVDAELGAAEAMGLTAIRVFLHNMAYDADPRAWTVNIEKFLVAAHSHGIGVGFVFFDDCWNHAGASTSVQCAARPGIHNGCSMASPQDTDRTNTSRFESYVTDTIKAHVSDPRVLWWGMFNEPQGRGAGWSDELRHAAFGWAISLHPVQPVTSCWDTDTDGNTDTQLQNVHHYDSNFNALTHQAWQGMTHHDPPQGSVVTEAGCRWFQGESGSSGSPLEMVNWLHALRAAQAPYVPGAFLAWTVIVGNDNTRWHWGSRLNTPEPAIPWCGLMWPDGFPVSFTEASAISEYTGKGTPGYGALPAKLFVQTFLPRMLDALLHGGGSNYLTVAVPAIGAAPTAVPLNYTLPETGYLIEITVWPTWPANVTPGASACGVLAQTVGAAGLFAGVTDDGVVVVEEWRVGVPPEQLGAFNLSSLPPNQSHAAVNGWNMLRLQISADVASVWFNPTHADKTGPQRGMRLSRAIKKPDSACELAAAVRGGAGAKVDYVGVFKA